MNLNTKAPHLAASTPSNVSSSDFTHCTAEHWPGRQPHSKKKTMQHLNGTSKYRLGLAVGKAVLDFSRTPRSPVGPWVK